MNLKTLKNADLNSKRVLLRTDFNVPIQNGEVQDKTRLEESLATLQYLRDRGAKTIIVTHLGRPDGQVKEELRLDLVANELSKLLNQPVTKLSDSIGLDVEVAVNALQAGDFILLENVRFHKEEEENDKNFAAELAKLADVYVNDAFGTAHRAHASTEGVAHLLPAYAGLLMEKEVTALSKLMESPEHPVCLIAGGAKIDTKIGVLEKFLTIADTFVIGGALANTFLAAQGYSVGKSLCEPDKIDVAKHFLEQAKGKTVLLQPDAVTAQNPDSEAHTHAVSEIPADEMILDLGPQTLALFTETLKSMKTVIWNGPMGLYEKPAFEAGTKAIAQALSGLHATTVVGGGDSIDAIHHFGIDTSKFTHISTGGGAMLEFLQGKPLPGVQVLYTS